MPRVFSRLGEQVILGQCEIVIRGFLQMQDLFLFQMVEEHRSDGTIIGQIGLMSKDILFEDRVMKIGRVEIGAGVTVGARSTILYDAAVGAEAFLGPLTLVAKGESLPAGTQWEGSPAAPVRDAPHA